MPMAIPLIAAYASVSAGIALGTATLSASIIGGMMIAGGAMTAMGALTKDKTLSQWGGILSLAGGAAGLADGAWASASEEIAAGSGVGLPTDGTELTPEQLNAGNPADAAAAQATQESAAAASQPVVPQAAPGGMLATTGTPPPAGMIDPLDTAATEAGGPVSNVASPQVKLTDPGAQPMLTGAAAPAGPASPAGAPITATSTAAAPPAPGASAVAQPVPVKAPVDTTGGLAQPYVDFAKANPRLVQAGSGLLTAGLNYYGQQDAVKTSIALQEQAQQRARDRINASTRGLAVPTYQPRKG